MEVQYQTSDNISKITQQNKKQKKPSMFQLYIHLNFSILYLQFKHPKRYPEQCDWAFIEEYVPDSE